MESGTPVQDQQPSVEQPQQEEPPTEIQDITAGKEEVNGEDPMNHYEEKEKDASGDSDLETDLQELAEAKTGGKGGDGPDVQEELASNTEPVEMPEAGYGCFRHCAEGIDDQDLNRLPNVICFLPFNALEAAVLVTKVSKFRSSAFDIRELDLIKQWQKRIGLNGESQPQSPSGQGRENFGLGSEGTNMSGQMASTFGPIDQDCSQLDEPVVHQQPSVEQPQQEEPPAGIQDITPRKEEVNGEDPVNHDEEKEKDASGDSDLETDLQDLAEAKTGGKGGDGPDVQEEIASNVGLLKCLKQFRPQMPECLTYRFSNKETDRIKAILN
ncbi:hypothetical protein E5288_WYG013332 [Bos mutus]|uniref:GAGE domain-containing protein n=1 Tax=Bos mutus TaxID=72004 RepID=A0A6B0SAN3_9CETA|nr:hypothetical protein [Bos mutus]